MTKYFIEIREEGHRTPVGLSQGYSTQEEVAEVAKRFVDLALPLNTVHVLKEVGYAYLAGDGTEEWVTHKE